MKNILDKHDKKSILDRASKISIDDKAQWGKMNVHQMICHCSDQLKMSMGLKETKYIGKPVIDSVGKRLILMGVPIPRGKIKTVKELDQAADGTQPTEFEKDKAAFIKLINDFESSFKNVKFRIHPVFGKMDSNEWGKLNYVHMNHHLTQFNR
jgi:hypothetical protein